MKKVTHPFRELAKAYDAVRPSYPSSVFSLLCSALPVSDLFILDLGCGTGISTRQLAGVFKNGFVIGSDKDMVMLEMALLHKEERNVAYVQGEAAALPFKKGVFDLITLFTAFHWFADPAAVKEMVRVLKPGGMLAIIQPRHVSVHAGDFRKILEKELGKSILPSFYPTNFVEVLNQTRVRILRTHHVKTEECYTIDKYMLLLQSYSLWEHVPPVQRSKVLRVLKRHFMTCLEADGFIHDRREIEILITKPKR